MTDNAKSIYDEFCDIRQAFDQWAARVHSLSPSTQGMQYDVDRALETFGEWIEEHISR